MEFIVSYPLRGSHNLVYDNVNPRNGYDIMSYMLLIFKTSDFIGKDQFEKVC